MVVGGNISGVTRVRLLRLVGSGSGCVISCSSVSRLKISGWLVRYMPPSTQNKALLNQRSGGANNAALEMLISTRSQPDQVPRCQENESAGDALYAGKSRGEKMRKRKM